MNKQIITSLSILILTIYGCDSRNMKLIETYDLRDTQILTDTGIIVEDVYVEDATTDTNETPLRLIFEPDNPRPLFGEVALIPSYSDEKTLVVDMLLGGDDNMKLSFYGVYYRISFPEDVLEVELISPHPELPSGIINKFTIRKGEIIGVITNKGDVPMFSLSCKRPLISVRFKIKMIRTGRIDIVSKKTQILDDKLKAVVNNYFGGKLTIIQK
ncbi:MAG: hypothetical protein ACP5QK_04250 [Myxococcota bacterium]